MIEPASSSNSCYDYFLKSTQRITPATAITIPVSYESDNFSLYLIQQQIVAQMLFVAIIADPIP